VHQYLPPFAFYLLHGHLLRACDIRDMWIVFIYLSLSLLGLVLLFHLAVVFLRMHSLRRVDFRVITDRAELGRQKGIREYFHGFGPCDIAARTSKGCSDIDGYLSSLVTEPDAVSVGRAARAARDADAEMVSWAQGKGHKKDDYTVALSEFVKEGRDEPWRVAILEDRAEWGWPHTHGGVVCIPSKLLHRGHDAIVSTFIHERVHVLQRRRPEEARRIAEVHLGLVPYPKDGDTIPSWAIPLMRSNPDLDDNVYGPARPEGESRDKRTFDVCLFESVEEARDGGLGMARTRRIHPETRLGDVDDEGNVGEEHPFETMAYYLQSLFKIRKNA
jgi:hypothetical protein